MCLYVRMLKFINVKAMTHLFIPLGPVTTGGLLECGMVGFVFWEPSKWFTDRASQVFTFESKHFMCKSERLQVCVCVCVSLSLGMCAEGSLC